MIGRRLSERHGVVVRPLAPAEAEARVRARLAADGRALIDVRGQGAEMIACLFLDADAEAVRLCRLLGLALAPGGHGVLGLRGTDAARLFARLAPERRAWLETPCGPRETKVLLLAGGIAMLSIYARDGGVHVEAVR